MEATHCLFCCCSGVTLSVEAFLPSPPSPPTSPAIDIRPTVIRTGVTAELTIEGLATSDGAWLVFLPAGDDTCVGAASASVLPAGDRLAGGKITVRLEQPGLHKLCVSSLVSPLMDTDFVVARGEEHKLMSRVTSMARSSSGGGRGGSGGSSSSSSCNV